MPELKIGYQGPLYNPWYDWAKQYASSYAFMLGARDGYFGSQEAAFVREMQRRLGLVIDGIFGDRTAARVGYKWPGASAPPVVKARRKIWIFTAPGSGADWWVGPSFELGQFCKDALNLNHQPLSFQKGGYLGFLGGDAKFSYNEVTYDLYKSLEWCLDNNADVQEALRARQANPAAVVEVEVWFSGYSQSAQGMQEAVEMLFGDGGFVAPGDPTQTPCLPGKYRLLRDRINGVIQFGNPSKDKTGISRAKTSTWLLRLIRNITTKGDFYAEVPLTDNIRPAFYAAIVKAEMELPFFAYVLKIAVPIISEWAATLFPLISPLLGGFGPMAQLGLGTLNGLQGIGGSGLFGQFMGQADGIDDNDPVPEQMLELLSPTGILKNVGGLIALVGALPGLQAHGEYHLSKPEFGGRTGIQVGCDLVRTFGTEWHK